MKKKCSYLFLYSNEWGGGGGAKTKKGGGGGGPPSTPTFTTHEFSCTSLD